MSDLTLWLSGSLRPFFVQFCVFLPLLNVEAPDSTLNVVSIHESLHFLLWRCFSESIADRLAGLGFFFFQIQQLFPLMPGRTLPGYRVPRDGERVHMEISSGQIQVTERVGGGAQKSPAGSLCLRTVDAEGHT